MTDGDAALDAEARLFGRYLVGAVPAPEAVARYRPRGATRDAGN